MKFTRDWEKHRKEFGFSLAIRSMLFGLSPPDGPSNPNFNEPKIKDLDNIQIGDKSDFFPAITRASRMLMGNDDEQPGHLVYVSDGRLILRNFQKFFSHVIEL